MSDHLEVEEFLLMGNLKRKEVEYFKTTWVQRWVVLVPDKFLIYAKRGLWCFILMLSIFLNSR
jgi:hypothetical protein